MPPKAKADVPLSKITMAKADEFGPADFDELARCSAAISAEHVTFFFWMAEKGDQKII